MGLRGPQPKPTAMKMLEGNPGHQKLNDKEPTFDVPKKMPSPPTWLLKEAKKEWKKLAPTLIAMGVLTEMDLDAFGAMCQNYAYYVEVDKKITKMGKSDEGVYFLQQAESGYLSPHPYLSLRAKYYDLWRKSLSDFGLTPATRSRIVAGGGSGTSAEDDIAGLLTKGM